MLTKVATVFWWAWVASDADVFVEQRNKFKTAMLRLQTPSAKKAYDLIGCRACIGWWIAVPLSIRRNPFKWFQTASALSAANMCLIIIEGAIKSWQRSLSKK